MHLPSMFKKLFVSYAMFMYVHGPEAEPKIRSGRTFAGPELMLKDRYTSRLDAVF